MHLLYAKSGVMQDKKIPVHLWYAKFGVVSRTSHVKLCVRETININQLLRRLLGTVRIVVLGKEVIGFFDSASK